MYNFLDFYTDTYTKIAYILLGIHFGFYSSADILQEHIYFQKLGKSSTCRKERHFSFPNMKEVLPEVSLRDFQKFPVNSNKEEDVDYRSKVCDISEYSYQCCFQAPDSKYFCRISERKNYQQESKFKTSYGQISILKYTNVIFFVFLQLQYETFSVTKLYVKVAPFDELFLDETKLEFSSSFNIYPFLFQSLSYTFSFPVSVFLGPHYFCKSHRGLEPALWLDPVISKYRLHFLGGSIQSSELK